MWVWRSLKMEYFNYARNTISLQISPDGWEILIKEAVIATSKAIKINF